MNYERVILELLERIQILEEKVANLEQNNICTIASKYLPEKESLVSKAKEYIIKQKQLAKQDGLSEITLVCNDIQKALRITNRPPSICAAMYDCMSMNDEILFASPSGKSTTVKIKYYIY